jgi:hypothetical protein
VQLGAGHCAFGALKSHVAGFTGHKHEERQLLGSELKIVSLQSGSILVQSACSASKLQGRSDDVDDEQKHELPQYVRSVILKRQLNPLTERALHAFSSATKSHLGNETQEYLQPHGSKRNQNHFNSI